MDWWDGTSSLGGAQVSDKCPETPREAALREVVKYARMVRKKRWARESEAHRYYYADEGLDFALDDLERAEEEGW